MEIFLRMCSPSFVHGMIASVRIRHNIFSIFGIWQIAQTCFKCYCRKNVRRIHIFTGIHLCQRSSFGLESSRKKACYAMEANIGDFPSSNIDDHTWEREHCKCYAESQCNSNSVGVNAAKPHVKTRSLFFHSISTEKTKHSRTINFSFEQKSFDGFIVPKLSHCLTWSIKAKSVHRKKRNEKRINKESTAERKTETVSKIQRTFAFESKEEIK